MDPLSVIAGAIIAGATAAAKDTTQSAIKDAYKALKTIIVRSYKLASIRLLDSEPGDKSYQEAVRKEIIRTPKLQEDSRVLEAVAVLQQTITSMTPQQQRAVGLKSREIIAGRDIILKRIEGISGGADVDTFKARRNVVISNVRATGAVARKKKVK